MDTTTRLILPEVAEALEQDPNALVELTEELLPADMAEIAEQLPPELARKLLQVLPIEVSARLLESCEEEPRHELFAQLAAQDLDSAAAITDEMAPDDRADLYAELAEPLRARLLDELDPEESRDIRQLLTYPEDSAGGVMTTDFAAVPATTTVADAIEQVRSIAQEFETIYIVYAVDSHGTLLGVVSLRDLVTSPLDRAIEDIMNPNVIAVAEDTDQEEVARLMAKYDLLALPVVDRSHHVLGVITVDDVMDVVEAEATEDAHKIGAVEPIDRPYLATSITAFVRARAPWLILLFVMEFFATDVLHHYASASIASVAMLMWFVPMITSSGGNSGSQSATLVIRAMAVGEIEPRDAIRILGREVLIGAALGLTLGVIGAGRALVWDATQSIDMALAIGCAVAVVVTFGAFIGTAIPLLLHRLRIDPAVSSTPFVASLVDVGGLILYFEVARLFVG